MRAIEPSASPQEAMTSHSFAMPNPSVKGTKCGEPHFAPYLER
jgi:hypothetical protein